MDVKSLIVGPPVVDYVRVADNQVLSRLVSIAVDSLQCPLPLWTMLFTYPIIESTSVYSTLFLECKEAVEARFTEHARVLCERELHNNAIVIDIAGNACPRELLKQPLTVYELIDVATDRSTFKTVELGCCHTYAHQRFGTKCLTGAILTWESGVESVESQERIQSHVGIQ